jgi:hypothetical protein
MNRRSGEDLHRSEERFNPAANAPVGEEVDSQATYEEMDMDSLDRNFFGGL